MHQLTPEQQFAQLMAGEPSRPFVTYYDEATGERSELSVKSLANWVAKTHHLLQDELGLGVGDAALVDVPAHWISVPALLGCLTAGLAFTTEADDAAVAFVTPETAKSATGVLDVYAVAPASAAVGLRDEVPEGMADYVSSVRPQPDAWAGVQLTAVASDACLPGLNRGEVTVRAAERAAALGLVAGGRLLTTQDWYSPSDWFDAVLAPLAVGGSLVIVRNADDDVVARRVDQERVTARL